MRVAVILVNYGQWELTRRCLRSLQASDGVDLKVTLVDNRSPGPVPEWVEAFPALRFRRLEENTGFAGGCNAGFRMSLEDGADLTFFLNNDASVLPGTVAGLAEYLVQSPSAGIAAPAVYRDSDPETLWGAGGKLVRWKMRYEQVDIPEELYLKREGMKVDFVSGCALMVRSGLFDTCGGFRDDFFMYYEDADLCRKVFEAGYSVEVVPSLRVLHSVAAGSGSELSKLAVYFSERNRILLSRDTLTPATRRVFIAYKTAVLLVLTVKFLATARPSLIRWIWRGYLEGLAGRAGYREVIGKLV